MKYLKRLLDLMFDPEDEVCPSSDKWAYHSMPITSILSGEVKLVSPNQKVPVKTVSTENLILLAINAIKGFRNDSNVTVYRSFLWEVDVGSLASQMAYTGSLGLPTSAAIYSGNKSIHFITTLDTPIDEKTYRILYQWALNIGTLYDPNCKNPSRSIRIPGSIRPETGKEQKLIEIKGRIKLDDFLAWLNQYPDLRPKEREKKILTEEQDYEKLSPWAKSQLKNGIDFSRGRNQTWFAIACDLYQSGHDEEAVVDILEQYFVEEHDFKHKEFLIAIGSACKYMANKG